MKKFDASLPRKMFWSKDVGGKEICPECHGRLERERHTYMLFTQEGRDFDSFVVGNDSGYFCARCPVVVLDYEAFAESAMVGKPTSGSFEFTVPGIVDLDAIPEDKKNIPLGEDDNPIPLMKFTNLFDNGDTRRRRSRDRRRKKRRKQRR